MQCAVDQMYTWELTDMKNITYLKFWVLFSSWLSAEKVTQPKQVYYFLSAWTFSALTLLVEWQKEHPACKNLAIVLDISGCGTVCSTLWQAHLPVNTTEGATGLPRLTWKMAIKTMCVFVHQCIKNWALVHLFFWQMQQYFVIATVSTTVSFISTMMSKVIKQRKPDHTCILSINVD